MDKKKKLLFILLVSVLLLTFGVLTWYVVRSKNLGAEDSEAGLATSDIKVIYEVKGEGGSIEGKTIQSIGKGDTTTPVKAVPKDGYYFSSWNDGITSQERSDKSYKNRVFRAVFKTIPTTINTIKYIAGEGGDIEGDKEQKVKFGEFGTTVKAIAKDGYEFRGWSAGTEYFVRKDKGNGRDITYKAFFQKQGEEKSRVEYVIEPAGYGEFVDRNNDFPIQYLSPGEEGTPVRIKTYDFTELVIWSDGLKGELTRKDNGTGKSRTIVAILKSKYDKKGTIVHYSSKVEGSNETKIDCGYIQGQNIQYIRSDELGEYVVARVLDKRCEFVKWSDGNTKISRIDSWNNEYYKEYTAIFRQKSDVICTSAMVDIKYDVQEPAHGYIEGDRVQMLPSGCSNGRVVKAVPYSGYKFAYWDNHSVKAGYRSKNPLQQYTGWQPRHLTAIFVKEGSEEKDSESNTNICLQAVSKIEYTVKDSAWGYIEGETTQTLASSCSNAKSVKAVPKSGYKFAYWEIGEETINCTGIQRLDAGKKVDRNQIENNRDCTRTFNWKKDTSSQVRSVQRLDKWSSGNLKIRAVFEKI